MTTTRSRPLLARLLSLLRRLWRPVASGLVKGFVLFFLVIVVLEGLFDSSAPGADFVNALVIVSLLGISLAYLLFVSPQVHLSIPGMDEVELDREGAVSPQGQGPLRGLHDRTTAHRQPGQSRTRGTTLTTLQVRRLAAGGVGITIVNDAPLPVLRARMGLDVERATGDDHGTSTKTADRVAVRTVALGAQSQLMLDTTNTFDHVGIYRLGSAGVRVFDLVGLFSRMRSTPGQWRVRVVPNLYRIAYGIPRDRKVSQDSLGLPDTPADALDYDRVRDYQPGDPLKTIHWKMVAHGQGELYTKLFETPTMTSVTLVLDPHGPTATGGGAEVAYHQHDTMLEGGFTLIEHARENGITGHLRFLDRAGSLVETSWKGPGMLGWFVETARRPSRDGGAVAQSQRAIQSLHDRRAGYVIFATSELTEESVDALVACHLGGVPLLVVHSLPPTWHPTYNEQRFYDEVLREASIGVVELSDGPQIVREVSVS